MLRRPLILAVAVFSAATLASAAEPQTFNLWPGKPPGEENVSLPPEADINKPTDKLIAGRKIIKLGNVSTPTLALYAAPADKANGAAVIICPGGGHHILAYDLEGTEVAEWLNTLGVTAFVLKYRVPARNKEKRWEGAVQDAERAVSVIRSRAGEWKLDAKRIGVLGFSAGGETAGLTAIFGDERQYVATDAFDKTSCRPDFAILIYPGGFADKDNQKLRDYIKITAATPPMFFAHAFDDGVRIENSVLPFLELKKAGVPAELHAYSSGGHGFGLRKTEQPCTEWPARCGEWLKVRGLLEPASN